MKDAPIAALCDLPSLLNRLHTTPLGAERIRRNLSLTCPDVVVWCRERIRSENAAISRAGKNIYIVADDCVITVNAYSDTIITAHPLQQSKRATTTP